MNRTLKVVAVLLCVGLALPAAYAQCTTQTLMGTYAFYEKGASAILDPTPNPLYPYHWVGAIAPFVTVGEITVGADGVGHGYFWIRVGSLNGGLDPIPFQTTPIVMDEDCTGTITATFNLAGETETIVERIVVFDNGRQYRAIPIGGGMPTLAWIHEGHRIGKPGEPPNSCGPQTALGTYVMSVENMVWFAEEWPIFSDVVMLRYHVSMTGEVAGTMYEKLGPYGGIELPVSGTITVNPDCSFASTLNVTIQNNPVAIPARGVFFDGGKKFYVLNMNQNETGTLYSFGQGERIGQQLPLLPSLQPSNRGRR